MREDHRKEGFAEVGAGGGGEGDEGEEVTEGTMGLGSEEGGRGGRSTLQGDGRNEGDEVEVVDEAVDKIREIR